MLLPRVRSVHPLRVLGWLYLGMKDCLHNPWLSLSHGLALALGGGWITFLAHDQFWLLAGALSGFMVIAPVLATSLYAMSRAIERKERCDWHLLQRTWIDWQQESDPHQYWALVRFGLLLSAASTGWVLTSSALITLLSDHPIAAPIDFLRHVVLNKDSLLFELWLALGALMAVPMYASSVVAIPLLLDRKVGLMQAVLTGWQAVLQNPITLSLWAFVILLLSLLGLATFFMGLLLVVPVLGHASWHAYRALVDTSGLAPRKTVSELA